MLGQGTREAEERAAKIEDKPQSPIGRIETGLAHPGIVDRLGAPAPDRAGQRADRIHRAAARLADIATGAARAIGDHRGGDAGPGAPLLLVAVPEHLLAASKLR